MLPNVESVACLGLLLVEQTSPLFFQIKRYLQDLLCSAKYNLGMDAQAKYLLLSVECSTNR